MEVCSRQGREQNEGQAKGVAYKGKYKAESMRWKLTEGRAANKMEGKRKARTAKTIKIEKCAVREIIAQRCAVWPVVVFWGPP